MKIQQRILIATTIFLSCILLPTVLILTWIARQSLLERTKEDGIRIAQIVSKGLQFVEKTPTKVEEILGDQMVVQASIAAHLISIAEEAKLTPSEIMAHLDAITEKTVLDEFVITDEKGYAFLNSVKGANFTFNPDPKIQPQAHVFWPLLTGEKNSVIQSAMTREIDDKVFKYVAVAGVDQPRIVEIGYELTYLENLKEELGLKKLIKDLLKDDNYVKRIRVFDGNLKLIIDESNTKLKQNIDEKELNFLKNSIEAKTTKINFQNHLFKVATPLLNDQNKVVGITLVYLSTESIDNHLTILVSSFLLVCLLIMVIAGFFSIIFSRYLSKPILALNDATQSFSYDNFQTINTKSNIDEIDTLSESFNQIAKQLKHTFTELEEKNLQLQEFNQNLEQKVNQRTIELEQTNQQLAISKVKAEEVSRLKSEFLANMSHEIRTPMNGVLGIAQLLSTTSLTEEQRDFVQIIQDSGDALLIIINDILDFSKIESGMLELEEKVFVLQDLIKSVHNLLNRQALDKGIKINYFIADDVPNQMLGDISRLRQIFLNLVGNAIKFTPQGKVSISVNHNNNRQDACSTTEVELMIAIQDQGIGIDGDRLNKLFQPFTQADASISRKYGGTGLGLAISKSLVNLMGGTIWVESLGNLAGNPPQNWVLDQENNEKKGSTFYFTLPFKTVDKRQINLLKTDPLFQEELQTDKSQLKILLAEDNKINQKVAILILKKLGYQADIADNGLEVLQILEKKIYDIILMDMQMPEMDGITATKKIRESSLSQPYIIALTANALEDDKEMCLNAGMNDYLSKPIAITKLTHAFSQYNQYLVAQRSCL